MKPAVWILRALGCAAIALAAWLAAGSLRLVLGGVAAAGSVSEVREVRNGGSRAQRAPVVQFRAEGRIVRGPLRAVTDPEFDPGDKVTVYYRPEAPERFAVATFGQLWERPAVLCSLALMLFAAAWLCRMSQRGATDAAVFGRAFQWFGAALLGGALLAAVFTAAEVGRGIHTVGAVLNGQGKPWVLFKSGDYVARTAEIGFTTTAGKSVTVAQPGLDANFAAPNQPVHMIYDIERPLRARIASFGGLWFNALLLAVFGAMFAAAGILAKK